MNLVSNAAESMEKTDQAVLRITSEHILKDNVIRVSFEDNGAGIPTQNRSRLFEPFYTTKKKGKGVGLGLSVAYGIVQEHGGSIDVRSREGEGKGTAFIVTLKLKTDKD